MPTYEYQCEKCKKKFELFQSMKDAPLKTCTPETCCMKKWGKGNKHYGKNSLRIVIRNVMCNFYLFFTALGQGLFKTLQHCFFQVYSMM